jgi:periplasmic protein TonB
MRGRVPLSRVRVSRLLPEPGMRPLILLTVWLAAAACGATPGSSDDAPQLHGTPVDTSDMPPVAMNPELPVDYPAALLEQGIQGTVILRLFVDAAGRVVPESTRVAESSGYPAMDSAAIRSAPALVFAPALTAGRPTAAPFLQPIHFRTARGGASP